MKATTFGITTENRRKLRFPRINAHSAIATNKPDFRALPVHHRYLWKSRGSNNQHCLAAKEDFFHRR